MRKPTKASASVAKATAREDHLNASRAPTILHAPMGVLSFDPDEFMHHIETLDMSDDEKRELLKCVWQIMTSFVAWNFSGATTPIMLEAESPGMIPFEYPVDEQKAQHAVSVEERIRDEAE